MSAPSGHAVRRVRTQPDWRQPAPVSQLLSIIVILLFLIGCTTVNTLATPVAELLTSQEVPAHTVDEVTLNRGRYIYLTRCADCHSVIAVDRLSLPRWEAILPDMARRARLSSNEETELLTYIRAAHEYLTRGLRVTPG